MAPDGHAGHERAGEVPFREHDLLSRDDVGGNGTEGYGERVEVVRRIQGERAQKEVDPLAGYDAHGQPDAVLEIEIDAGE
jgi:hypothetical protein